LSEFRHIGLVEMIQMALHGCINMHRALTDCGMDIYMFLEYLEQNASHAIKPRQVAFG
jgi:hypothetical protein